MIICILRRTNSRCSRKPNGPAVILRSKSKPGRKATRKPATKPSKRRQATSLAPFIGDTVSSPWSLRPYQRESVTAFDNGKRRQLLIWHRRAGKDVAGLLFAKRESQLRVGGYWHFFPKHVQARRALWNGIDPKIGRPFIDAAFGDIIAARNNTEMLLEFDNGSTWQLLGSDNYDRLVGGNACGVVFSEWALCDPNAWNYIRPIILENHGFAIFITTYRGRNHAWNMAQSLRNHPDWHVDVRTVADTVDIHGKRIITDEDIERERSEGTPEHIIQQEYYCNPAAAVPGAVYSVQAERLRADPLRTSARWNPLLPVYAAWHLEASPMTTAVVYAQPVGDRLSVIAAENMTFMPLADCIAKTRERPWRVNEHVIAKESAALLPIFSDLNAWPDMVTLLQPGRVEAIAQAAIERMDICVHATDPLLDSLTGYVRRDLSRDEQHPVFSTDYDPSWHMQLARAFEVLALYQHDGGATGWQRPQRYTASDRRTI